MASKVVVFSEALEDLAKLPHDMQKRITRALHELADFPAGSGIKKLKPPIGGYRKRVGEYRILFDAHAQRVEVHGIKHRKNAYRI